MSFFEIVLYPVIGGFLTVLGQKALERFKTPSQNKIDNADAKAKEIENEKSQLDLTKNLLEFAKSELDKAIEQIKKRDTIIENQDKQIETLKLELKERNDMFDQLTEKMTHVLTELSKYKQLNGKI
jgi:peptidoglycan hydrolase CwlO-like protein